MKTQGPECEGSPIFIRVAKKKIKSRWQDEFSSKAFYSSQSLFEPRSAIVQGVVYPEADVGGVKQRGRERGWASTAEAKANTKNGAKVGSWEHENF